MRPALFTRRFFRWYFEATRRLSGAASLMAIRETFITLLPFYIVSSVLEFWLLVFGATSTRPVLAWLNPVFAQMQGGLAQFFPTMVCLGLAYNLAKYRNLQALYSGALAVFCLHLGVLVMKEKYAAEFVAKMLGVSAIVIPFLVVALLDFVQKRMFKVVRDVGLSPLLTRSINLILPSVLTVALSHGALTSLAAFFGALQNTGNLLAQFPVVVQGAVHVFVSHFLWSFGLHGENLYNMVIGQDVLAVAVAPGFTVASLLSTFVTFGGCGGTLSLLLAMALNGRITTVAKISAPMQFFNINEIMVYGHPIVFNPYLILPFIFFPVVGFVVSYAVVASGFIPVFTNVQWMMPPGFNAYVAGNGNLLTIAFQVMMLSLGAAIYFPFLKLEEQDSLVHKLEKLFSDDARPQWDISHASEMRYASNHRKTLAIYADAMQAIDLMSSGRMCLWYQPTIDVHTQQVHSFEALLRIVMPDGSVVGPAFIKKLEAAGYSDALNTWVIQEAVRNLAEWKAQAFVPRISLNVTADFLSSLANVRGLINRLGTFAPQVRLEMLESSLASDFPQTKANVARLGRAGISLSVDDFGNGYSNFALLNQLDIGTIKLDKGLLEEIGTETGRVLYVGLCALMKQLGYELIAEGVETQEEADFVCACGTDVIQGFIHAAAMPPSDAMAYGLRVGLTSVAGGALLRGAGACVGPKLEHAA
ncbi:MAG: hypothetical protein JWP29_1292 [Rhodoferax sp.]|nr:hypothetical protein [Rhodoferax sp.]